MRYFHYPIYFILISKINIRTIEYGFFLLIYYVFCIPLPPPLLNLVRSGRGGKRTVKRERLTGYLTILLLAAFPFSGVATANHRFHFNLFFVSSTLTPTTCMSSFTASINLLFGRPLGLLPGSSVSSLLPMSPLSLLCTCPSHLNLASLAFSPSRYLLHHCST